MQRAENPLKSKIGLQRAMDNMCAVAIGFISAGNDKRADDFLEAAYIAEERMLYLKRRTKFVVSVRERKRRLTEV